LQIDQSGDVGSKTTYRLKIEGIVFDHTLTATNLFARRAGDQRDVVGDQCFNQGILGCHHPLSPFVDAVLSSSGSGDRRSNGRCSTVVGLRQHTGSQRCIVKGYNDCFGRPCRYP
jgi:hypothetical protein